MGMHPGQIFARLRVGRLNVRENLVWLLNLPADVLGLVVDILKETLLLHKVAIIGLGALISLGDGGRSSLSLSLTLGGRWIQICVYFQHS